MPMQPILMGKPEGSKPGIGKAETDSYLGFGLDAGALRLLHHCGIAAGYRASEDQAA